MGKLNQVIAVIAPKKSQALSKVTELYHLIQKSDLFNGISRTYRPKDEEGEQLPPEQKMVQGKTGDLTREARKVWTELFDVVATQDNANCSARGNVTVDGKVILSQVPVTHLLFLEKQLKDIETFISKLPVLDPAEKWNYNESGDFYSTEPSETARTKKVPRNHVKAAATKEHPAQVEMYYEDTLVGYWRTVKHSGALPARTKNLYLDRVHKLQEAVMKAREEANTLETTPVVEGKAIFDFLFGG